MGDWAIQLPQRKAPAVPESADRSGKAERA